MFTPAENLLGVLCPLPNTVPTSESETRPKNGPRVPPRVPHTSSPLVVQAHAILPSAESLTLDAVAAASTRPVDRHSASRSDSNPYQPRVCDLGLRTRFRPVTMADGVSRGPSSVADTTVSPNRRRRRPRSRAFAETAAAATTTAPTVAAAKGTSAGPTMEDSFHVDNLGNIVQKLSVEVDRLAKRRAEQQQQQ